MGSGGRCRLRDRRIPLGGWLVALVLVLSATAEAEVSPAPAVSIVQIPLELDLQPLFEAAQSALPRQAGHWPGWRDWHGIDTRYRAWRGPLGLAMQGDVLLAQAHVRYQLQARKNLLGGVGLSAGCGVEEPPRQAVVGVVARLDWAPDWSLYPRFQVLPTRFLDRCEVTLANLDVSPLVGEVFEDRIEESLRVALGALAPRFERLRTEAARAWGEMQVPRALAPGLYLHVQPLGLALAPLQGHGAKVQTAVWLAFRAALAVDSAARHHPTPLPPLLPFRPAQPGLRFALELEIDYPRISAALGGNLVGQTFEAEGRVARVKALELAPRGEELELALDLGEGLAGRLTITARPAFDAAAEALKLEDVHFRFDAADPKLGLLADLFYIRIRDRIEAEANRLLAERTRGIQAGLAGLLAAGLPPDLRPDLSGVHLTNLDIGVGETGLRFSGLAAGSLTLGRRKAIAHR